MRLRFGIFLLLALMTLALSAGCSGGSSAEDDPHDKYMLAWCDAFNRAQDSEPDVDRLLQDALDGDATALKALGLPDDPSESMGERVARIRAAGDRLTGRVSKLVDELEAIEPPGDVRNFHDAQVAYYRDLADRIASTDFDPSAPTSPAPTASTEVEGRLQAAIARVPECSTLAANASLELEPEEGTTGVN